MSTHRKYRILLVDDDELVLDGLAMVLEQSGDYTVSVRARNGAEALRALSDDLPDVVLLDIRMPDMDGLTCCRAIHAEYPNLPVLMLTTFADDEYLRDALAAGARGYLLKHQSAEAVMLAIRNAISGNMTFEPGIARSLDVRPADTGSAFLEGLSGRETDVLYRLVQGRSNREIADELYLSEGTVRNYVSSLLQFAGARDRTQLVIWYYQKGETNNERTD